VVDELAKAGGCSAHQVKDAMAILDKVTPELDEAITEGKITIHAAKKLANKPAMVQQKAVEDGAEAVHAIIREDKENEPPKPEWQIEMERWNREVVQWCNQAKKLLDEDNLPHGKWMDSQVLLTMERSVKNCIMAMQSHRAYQCKHCMGEGCDTCKGTGCVLQAVYQTMR
jgi:hypothetical protein